MSLVVAKKQGWNIGIRDDEKTRDTYLAIYRDIKPLNIDLQEIKEKKDIMKERLAGSGVENDLKKVLSESQTDIRKKMMEYFSLAKGAKSDYIPSASHRTGDYSLNIDLENINFDEIESDLKRLKLI